MYTPHSYPRVFLFKEMLETLDEYVPCFHQENLLPPAETSASNICYCCSLSQAQTLFSPEHLLY